MSASIYKVRGQLGSIKSTLMNMIVALRVKEDEAKESGLNHDADQLLLLRLQLNDQCIVLWKAEAAARSGESLSENIQKLQSITSEARKAQKTAQTAKEVLDAAVKIITLLETLGILIA